MPKSKIYTSPTAEDPSTNGTVTEAIGVVPLKKSEADSPEDHATGVAAGRLPEEVYTNTLSWRRAELRRRCVAVVEWETEVIATWQVLLSSQSRVDGERRAHRRYCVFQARVRSPWLDTYFQQTSMLGTHTFFLVFLPVFFFFGHFELGRG